MSETSKVQRIIAKMTGADRYGDDSTIHRTGVLDVEVRDGKVVAVWFRCLALPFRQTDADQNRAAEMVRMYAPGEGPNTRAIVAIETAPQSFGPRYRCRTCGCFWRRNSDGSWSLYDATQKCGSCCDNSEDFLSQLEKA